MHFISSQVEVSNKGIMEIIWINHWAWWKRLILWAAYKIPVEMSLIKYYYQNLLNSKKRWTLERELRKQLIRRVEFLKDLAGEDAGEAARLVNKLPGILAYMAAYLREHLGRWGGWVGRATRDERERDVEEKEIRDRRNEMRKKCDGHKWEDD